jgi:hypothetical protein
LIVYPKRFGIYQTKLIWEKKNEKFL